jgi:hypothetical protein
MWASFLSYKYVRQNVENFVFSIEIPGFLQFLSPSKISWNLEESMEARNRGGIGFLYRPVSSATLEQSIGDGNRVGIGLSYQPARLHRLAESIPGLLKSLKIPSLVSYILFVAPLQRVSYPVVPALPCTV